MHFLAAAVAVAAAIVARIEKERMRMRMRMRVTMVEMVTKATFPQWKWVISFCSTKLAASMVFHKRTSYYCSTVLCYGR